MSDMAGYRNAGTWGFDRERGTMRAKMVKDLIRFGQRVPELNGIGFFTNPSETNKNVSTRLMSLESKNSSKSNHKLVGCTSVGSLQADGMKREITTRKYPAYQHLIFRIHALRQMFQRRISDSDIRELLIIGVIIEEYFDDTPYPSCLVSGTVNSRPLHVIMAYNNVDREAIVITAYEPDPDMWSDHFTRRKS